MQSQICSATVKIKLDRGIIVGWYCPVLGTEMVSNS